MGQTASPQLYLDTEGRIVVQDRAGRWVALGPRDAHLAHLPYHVWAASDLAALDLRGVDLDSLAEQLDALDAQRPRPSVTELAYGPGITPELQQFLLQLQGYLWLTDVDYVLATLAAAVAKERTEDPLWLMLVSPSSSGKGEALRLLDDVVDERIKDVSLPGLISISGKGVVSGLLARYVNEDALLTITDFSSLLGDNRRSGDTKADLFNALRDIYDGEYARTLHGGTARWTGRLTLIAACTPAIDQFTAHADALGTRWLYFRQREHDADTKDSMASMVSTRASLREQRAAARDLATGIVLAGRARVGDLELPGSFHDAIGKTAVLAGYGRASVPRDYRRQIDDVVTVEDPGRLVGQLRLLATGLLALGVSEEVALRITRRAAFSSMPQARAAVLNVLAAKNGGPVSTYAVAKATRIHKLVADRALEDWQAVGVIGEPAPAGDELRPSKAWTLAGQFRALVATATGYPIGHTEDSQQLECET